MLIFYVAANLITNIYVCSFCVNMISLSLMMSRNYLTIFNYPLLRFVQEENLDTKYKHFIMIRNMIQYHACLCMYCGPGNTLWAFYVLVFGCVAFFGPFFRMADVSNVANNSLLSMTAW